MDIRELPTPEIAFMLNGTFEDAPILNFEEQVAKMRACETLYDVDWYNRWIDSQRVCSIIIKHHGKDGLNAVVRAIAEASVRLDASPSSRVQSIIDFYEMR